MSNLENMLKKIKEDNDEKISLLKIEIENKKKNFINEFEIKLNEYKKNIDIKFEEQKKLDFERINLKVNMEAKNILLKKKQEIISDILIKLKSNLDRLVENEILEFIEAKIVNENLNDCEIIVPNKYSFLKDKIDNLIFSNEIESGFLLKRDKMIDNYTFESLIKFKIEEIEKIIQKYF